tara:strand:+ start:297 stop:575 length:279 start_codon:yes stop_codon:yes gene_type:complete
MALVKNTRTGKLSNVPEHYLGHPSLGKELVLVGEEAPVEKMSVSKKKSVKYVTNAFDGDGDGLVQDGTAWERPEGTEIEEHTAPDEIENNEE